LLDSLLQEINQLKTVLDTSTQYEAL